MRRGKNKILVVEDESIVAAHIAESLKSSGYKVTDTVSHGEQAVESVMQNRPDLALMDIVLSGKLDGIEAAKVIYSNFDIPIIFLTAYSDNKTLKRAKETSPFGYLVKPFKEKDLHTGIQMALEKHRQEKELKERERWLSSSLRNLWEPVIATDTRAKVTFINRAAQSLIGLAENQALGATINDICGGDMDNKAGENPFAAVLKKRKPHFFNDCLIHGKEKMARVNIRVTLVLDKLGEILGAVGIFSELPESPASEEGEKEANGAGINNLEMPKKPVQTMSLCPWCKKVLNRENNQWEHMESYMAEHEGEIEFSHCMCQKCAKSLGLFDPEKISENDDMLI